MFAGPETAAGPSRRVLLIGGTSEIGLAILRRLAADGPLRPYLLGRDLDRLESALASLQAAGTEPGEVAVLDADDVDSHEPAIATAFERGGPFDAIVLAVGVLGAQKGLDSHRDEALRVMRVNFVGCGSLVLACMRALRSAGGGTLVVLSSVVAERPRSGNAIYGAAKAGLDALSQGLADAAHGDVRVLVVRPGFVRTRMTVGLSAAPFATSPEAVAEATASGLASSAHTVWVPGTLRYVFWVLRQLPRPIYRRLPL